MPLLLLLPLLLWEVEYNHIISLLLLLLLIPTTAAATSLPKPP
jgi:hypothetical protein